MDETIRSRIFEIADQLLSEGRKPTQQEVRSRLGSGSLTTINKGLNQWWSVLSKRFSDEAAGTDVPDPVVRLSNRIWNEALAHAERAHARQSEAELERLTQLKEEIDAKERQSAEQLARAQQTALQQQDQLIQLTDRVAQKDKEIAELNEQCFLLTREREQIARDDIQTGMGDALTEARVRIEMQAEEIERLQTQNTALRSENARLKHRLEQEL